MRTVLVCLVLLATAAGSAHADPQDLTGGALIAHYNPDYYGRYGWYGCDLYYDIDPISSCEEQNTSIEVNYYEPAIWFVVAAFDEDKQWAGVQFGFSDYNPDIMWFMDALPCYPSEGLEIPSEHWPGPNEGTAFVVTDVPWSGNFVPVYGFASYAYGYDDPDVIQLIPDPTGSDPFGGFVNCDDPPEAFDAILGGLGINHPGTYVCWGWQYAVCCIGEDCILVQSEQECLDQEGEYHPEWDSCGPPNPCEIVPTTITSWGRLKTLYR